MKKIKTIPTSALMIKFTKNDEILLPKSYASFPEFYFILFRIFLHYSPDCLAAPWTPAIFPQLVPHLTG